MRCGAILCLAAAVVWGEEVRLKGLRQPVEILRDRWGVPHIYAGTVDDLFFAQGYMAARDRLFQIDLWRRINTGKLAEVQGEQALGRDRIARLVRFRGDWEKEWSSYAPDARRIVTAFVNGVNAYIEARRGDWPLEFRLAGYEPGLWAPEDCLARVAGLLMTRNVAREVERALDVRKFGLELVAKVRPPDPLIRLSLPQGLSLDDLRPEILSDYNAAIGGARIDVDQGSNNWVVDGTRTVSGKPLLANDPHRPLLIPSLRKTVHLVGPGWNAIGAGEPALPGIALGHNEHIAFGFTIVGIDQADLYVERLHPQNPNEYWYRGGWRKMEVLHEKIAVKGRGEQRVELRYTVHGPVIDMDLSRHRAYALRWVGAEPGGAGYLAALSLARATNWGEFLQAVARYKVPSENLVYADRAGNIGWVAAGLAPIRKNWSGLLPVPGDSGAYEWSGFLRLDQHPQEFNPMRHWIATANHKILPNGYPHALSYEWAAPFRYERIVEMLSEKAKFDVADFERMQLDVTSMAAKRFQQILRKHAAAAKGQMRDVYQRMLAWDAVMRADSEPAALFALWLARLPQFLIPSPIAARMDAQRTLELLSERQDDGPLRLAWEAATGELEKRLGPDRSQWQWGRLHQLRFEHPLRVSDNHTPRFHLGPLPRPGDANTVNAAGGADFRQTSGASYRQIIDLANWDRSVMTNVPGESGDPTSKHYSDLLEDWAAGRYHPMPFSRQAVEAAADERILLLPAL